MGPTAVVSLGGGSVLRPSQRGAVEEYRENLEATCRALADLTRQGYGLVVSHSSRVQVGNIVMQNVQTQSVVPAMPLDVLEAQSLGQTGYLIQGMLEAALLKAGVHRPVACLLTRVLVDPADPAFAEPSQPVGPIYTPSKAMELMRRGHVLREEPRGWRKLVPAPQPLAVVEAALVRALLEAGAAVIAVGGGGIPVVRGSDGTLTGVEALVEKDLTAARLALEVGAELLVLLIQEPRVALTIGGGERGLSRLTPAAAEQMLAQDHFAPGLADKVAVAARFVAQSGGRAIITNVQELPLALHGAGGTVLEPGA